jgi:hypothetical protein
VQLDVEVWAACLRAPERGVGLPEDVRAGSSVIAQVLVIPEAEAAWLLDELEVAGGTSQATRGPALSLVCDGDGVATPASQLAAERLMS